MPSLGAFEDYCGYVVTQKGLGQQDRRVYGPWPDETAAKLAKKRHERKGRTAVVVEQHESPDPSEVTFPA